MLQIGGGELIVILLIGLVVLGPERLPEVARQVGKTVGTLRQLTRSFQAEFEAAAQPVASPQPSTRSRGDTAETAQEQTNHRYERAERVGIEAGDRAPDGSSATSSNPITQNQRESNPNTESS